MKNIIFASNNKHKAEEIRVILGSDYQITTLKDAGIDIEIPEPHHTLKENALEKARTIFGLTNANCFSEDTGLEVEALNGAPGVFSARYAGEEATAEENIKKIMLELNEQSNRNACFTTCICLILNGKTYFFEGKCAGTISFAAAGTNGFGYDPVFIPTGYVQSFAEMDQDIKAKISHRRIAVSKMVEFLHHLKDPSTNKF